MKRVIVLFTFAILLTSFASADILINKQPKEIYNLGDAIEVPVTVIATNTIQADLTMQLWCNGPAITFYTNGVNLQAGEEKQFDPSAILTKAKIGTIKGKCKIKATLGSETPVFTNEFRISDVIKVYVEMEGKEFNPGDKIFIEGSAVKENGNDVNGFIEVEFSSVKTSGTNESNATESVTMVLTDAVDNGFFSIKKDLATDMPAGIHPMKLKVYEKDTNGLITNQGSADSSIRVLKKPTSLEILLENSPVIPGTDLNTKAILHDQTGEPIDSKVILTIKKSDGTILEQTEKATNEYLTMPIMYNEPPAEWKVVAVSNEFQTEKPFNISEKKDIEIQIINSTLIVTNTGNVLYNDTVIVKIGNETIALNTTLDVDESKEYKLTAPEGEYEVEIIADGEDTLTQSVMLTGKAIDVEEFSNSAIKFIRHPFVWVFIIAILGFIAFMFYKKGYKKSFFGKIPSFKFKKNNALKGTSLPLKKNSLISSKNKAELSLSIKGEKQNSSLICLKIKNLDEIQSSKSNAEEKLQEIVNSIEELKASTYEYQGHLFFIFAPIRTKTFANEKSAINAGKKIKESLESYNKMAKQKIDFGLSINYGTIVAKQEPGVLKFMSMGTLITTARKISNISKGEILLSDKFKSKLGAEVKTEKHQEGNLEFYSIKEIKDREEHKDFIKNFISRLEKS